MDLKELTYETMLPHVGSTFRIEFADRTLELELVRVDMLREKHTSKRLNRDSFALIFRGPNDVMLRQGTYPLDHAILGPKVPIFIVPLAREEEGVHYEAIFT
ncbi:MAG: hypothetical protein JOZ54_06475 [Acidobacteria bacterium]|nr:hypothetical protein [Acidobacteriota bacterium]